MKAEKKEEEEGVGGVGATPIEGGEMAAAAAARTTEEEEAEGTGATLPPELPAFEEGEVGAVEDILGYRFNEPVLVAEALTHASYYFPMKPGKSYERLEYVGDAVLNCVVGRELFSSYPDLPPGPLTKLRAANSDTEKLARVAVAHRLYRFLRHKTPQLEGQIQEFMEAMLDYPIHSFGLLDVPKTLADIVESLLGAVFMDSNSCLEAVLKVFKRLSGPWISPETLGKHPVSELYELCQKKGMRVRFLKDTWLKTTTVEVLVDGKLVGSATYGHKKEIAQNRAAKAALENLKVAFTSDTGSPTPPSDSC